MTLNNDEKSEEESELVVSNWHQEFDDFWLENSEV